MILLDLIQTVLNAQLAPTCTPGMPAGTPCTCSEYLAFGGGMFNFGLNTYCPGSAFSPITAAYQTQGMWVQADLITQIMYTKFGSLASLIYVIAAIGGLIGVALGAPPKMYLWFFFGPAIFHWLLGATLPVKGVSWLVANQVMDQREVWKLSEVGLINSNWKYKAQGVYKNKEPDGYVEVSLFFAIFDDLISGTIQNLISWTGMYNMRASSQSDNSTSIGKFEGSGKDPTLLGDKWFLLSNSKWGMVENITNAKFGSPHARDTIVTFFAGDCGDAFAGEINSAAFINALYGRGRTAPVSIFQGVSGEKGVDPLNNEKYEQLFSALRFRYTLTPRSLKYLIAEEQEGSFVKSLKWDGSPDTDVLLNKNLRRYDELSCATYFQIVAELFRWEAGHIYHQFMRAMPAGLNEDQVVFNLLYGWDLTNAEDKHLNVDEAKQFLMNLILVHLVRNEMQIINVKDITQRQVASDIAAKAGEGHLRYVATKNKFQEVYQWALLIPHMQGVLLYYLALAYPFACLMIIMPGQHKMLQTWMSFWVWAKLWDFGFALVTAVERSVWAMVGNNSSIQKNFHSIINMSQWGLVGSQGLLSTRSGDTCPDGLGACPYAKVSLCDESTASSMSGGAMCTTPSSYLKLEKAVYDSWSVAAKIFDRAISVSSNLDLDLSNSYYIYIMAGLYMSVPVVTGQLVLGAKSGMTSLVNNIIGGVGSEAGRQAASGYQSDLVYRMKTNMASTGQAAWMSAMRAGNGETDVIGHDADGNPMHRGFAEQAGRYANGKIGAELRGQSIGNQKALRGAQSSLASDDANRYFRATNKGNALLGLANETYSVLPDSWKSRGANGQPNQGGPLSKAAAVARDIGAIGTEQRWMGALDTSAANHKANARLDADSLRAGTAATQYGNAEGRMGRYGSYEADMAAWEAKNAYAANFNAQATALGGFTGLLDAGPKPTDMQGMQGSGEMGQSAYDNYWSMDPGESHKDTNGFWGFFNADGSDMSTNFGSMADGAVGHANNMVNDMEQTYTSWGSTGAFAESTGVTAANVKDGIDQAIGTAMDMASPEEMMKGNTPHIDQVNERQGTGLHPEELVGPPNKESTHTPQETRSFQENAKAYEEEKRQSFKAP